MNAAGQKKRTIKRNGLHPDAALTGTDPKETRQIRTDRDEVLIWVNSKLLADLRFEPGQGKVALARALIAIGQAVEEYAYINPAALKTGGQP